MQFVYFPPGISIVKFILQIHHIEKDHKERESSISSPTQILFGSIVK